MATILVIDDERMLCDLLQEMLRRHGHEVFTAYSGQEGIQAFQRHRPQFTLLDLHLPDMNGIEALTRIREHDPKAVAMILTGAGSDKLERQARDLGVTDFLIKGLSPEVLISAVARALQPPVQPASPESGGGIPRTSHDESILVVDDERQICELLKKYLTNQGFRVHTAQDGPTALAMADLERPQLIVLDIYMPGMTGVEVLRKLRAKKFPGGVMMLTGCEDHALLKEALDLESLDIIGKPFDLERIGLAVEVSLILTKKPGAKAAE
ncbi:MAG: response regulator [Nitrospirales bacterium]|nr:response regulator [Nitrospirales bacterium]